ncbi:MAG: hypothetical protein U0350_25240 [Caldilineaceae bacterium]
MLYPIVLGLHNLNRWLVLGFGLWAFYRLFTGWHRPRAWSGLDQKSVNWFLGVLTLQFLLGATLYALPGALVQSVLQTVEFAVMMKQRVLRFFVLEHPLQMVMAVACAYTLGFLLPGLQTDQRRFAIGALLLGIALLLIVTAVPWPFLSQGRPLLRLP